ncbi:dTDP-4-amino-4,6-dideoxygalactose transaminase [Clostridium cavendishii DSM 21758]|uniref:dTDP-4-amino-4,6-dideoxygalactose transaminase n=1 Tax=Clostridium cavendishii DSM 21758 TaxID=1121302 RepID=A0A1M6QAG5_9CLOT|nr:DegT/DnrJ/EryC1/StrS family aminotransferase [Clostridium cavendishii]SHK17284.1 dTDP-4-amino-4,6-dideoxygalactose transaminase [Clostridium cavendishii DSM 21758]
MARYLKPIGGEFWFQNELFDEKINNFKSTEGIFLDGGQSSLHYIYKVLNLNSDEYILMPSYICPSLLIGLKSLNINYVFYDIDKELNININSIEKLIKSKKIRAIFFVNYFGFYHNKETLNYLSDLKKKGIILIEDATQMLWFNKTESFIGDFIFNSYRKFLPTDGSILIGEENYEDVFDEESNYSKIVNKARILKTFFVNQGCGRDEEFLKLYSNAEEEYYKNIVPRKMILKNKKLLNNCDLNYIKNIRINNFKFLEEELRDFKYIEPIFKSTDIKEAPLGFIVFAKNRDGLRSFLRSNRIFAPVHWKLNNEEWAKDYKEALFVSNNILTLPIDQRYDYEDMFRIVLSINQFYSEKVGVL